MSTRASSAMFVFSLVSLVLSAFSGIGLLVPEFALVALPGLVVGLIALILGGRSLAKAGVVLSTLFPVLAGVLQVVMYYGEAPHGYERLSFQTVVGDADGFARLSGRQISIKGYAWPQKGNELNSFVLSPDGGEATRETAVIVELQAGQTWSWNSGGVAVSGVLIPNPDFREVMQPYLYTTKYKLVKSSVRPSRSRIGLAYRTSRTGC